MIELVIVFESIKSDYLSSVLIECTTLEEIEEQAKWYFDNRIVKSIYIVFRGEN